MNTQQKHKAVIASEGDHLIITVPNDLKAKAEPGKDTLSPQDAIANAEKALEELSENFDQWLEEEVNTLFAAWEAVKANSMADPHGKKLFLAAHDLKGQAETLGHPLIGAYCTSLCKLFDPVNDYKEIPIHAVESHILAVMAAFRGKIKDRENAAANAVHDRLLEVSSEFFNHHNKLRMEEYEDAKARDIAAAKNSAPPNMEDLAAASGAVIIGKETPGSLQ